MISALNAANTLTYFYLFYFIFCFYWLSTVSENKYSLIGFTFTGTLNQLHFMILFIFHLISFFSFFISFKMEYACLLVRFCCGSKHWRSNSNRVCTFYDQRSLNEVHSEDPQLHTAEHFHDSNSRDQKAGDSASTILHPLRKHVSFLKWNRSFFTFTKIEW